MRISDWSSDVVLFRSPATGEETQSLVYPDELRLEVQSWQTDSAPTLAYLLVPDQCEQRLQGRQPLTDDEASYLFNLFQECDAGAEIGRASCRERVCQ